MIVVEDYPVTNSHVLARRAMIDSQLRTSGVTDPAVLAAMLNVPRELYVSPVARAAAYADRAVSLGDGAWLAPPLFHGRMLAEAQVTGNDTVLLIGKGDGYLGALLQHMGTVPDILEPAQVATQRVRGGPWSLVLIDGATEVLPDRLTELMADNGRVVTGMVERGITRLAIGRKVAGALSLLPVAEMGIPVLHEFAALRRWSF